MVFEIGKYYKHTSGTMIHPLVEVETTQFGKALIAETNETLDFVAVGRTYEHAMNYAEITKEEWESQFSD